MEIYELHLGVMDIPRVSVAYGFWYFIFNDMKEVMHGFDYSLIRGDCIGFQLR